MVMWTLCTSTVAMHNMLRCGLSGMISLIGHLVSVADLVCTDMTNDMWGHLSPQMSTCGHA